MQKNYLLTNIVNFATIGTVVNNLFSGRISRLNFFVNWLVYTTIFLILVSSDLFLIGANKSSQSFVYILLAVIYIIGIIYTSSLYIRRLHDINQSGWLTFLIIVPLVNFGLLLFLIFKKGSPEMNRYGPVPLKNRYP